MKPGGLLLLAVHLGENALHLEASGWHVEETTERNPYPGVETQTRRVYILANAS